MDFKCKGEKKNNTKDTHDSIPIDANLHTTTCSIFHAFRIFYDCVRRAYECVHLVYAFKVLVISFDAYKSEHFANYTSFIILANLRN